VSSGEECARFVREQYCRGCLDDDTDNGAGGSGGGSGGKRRAMKALWFTWRESESQNPMQFLSYCEGSDGHEDAVDDNNLVGIDVAKTVDEADFILLHGSEVWRRCRESIIPGDGDNDMLVQDLSFLYNEDFSTLDPILEAAAARNLPCVCANPDLVVGLPGGVVGNMPGKIAQRYENMGGSVRHFGKPNPRHFNACLENLGFALDEDADAKSIRKVAHVGDSLEHDVAGANRAGIDSVFVLGGIHANELGLTPTGCGERDGFVILEDDNDSDVPDGTSGISKNELIVKLQSMFDEKGIWPTHVVPSLSL